MAGNSRSCAAVTRRSLEPPLCSASSASFAGTLRVFPRRLSGDPLSCPTVTPTLEGGCIGQERRLLASQRHGLVRVRRKSLAGSGATDQLQSRARNLGSRHVRSRCLTPRAAPRLGEDSPNPC